jgi:imidazolonepropionase-like amidohydrolase
LSTKRKAAVMNLSSSASGLVLRAPLAGNEIEFRRMNTIRIRIASVVIAVLAILFGFPGTNSAQAVDAGKSASGEAVVLRNVTAVDVRTGGLRSAQAVIIKERKIAWIGPDGGEHQKRKTAPLDPKGTAPAADARSIDCSGLFVIPGLWDMHVHLVFGDWFPKGRKISLPLFVANGVTGVRDMGSDLETVQGWRAEIATGELIGPRIYTSGPMLDGPKPRFPSSVAIATAEDGRRAVDDLKRRGADFIKLQSLIPRDGVLAIADEAKKQGIAFAGHVPDSVRASEMSEHGMKSFEHLIGIFEGSSPAESEFLKGNKTERKFLATYDAGRATKLAELLAKNGTWQCPTLVWERGGNMMDATEFVPDWRLKYVPAEWKNVTWNRFTNEIIAGYGSDDSAIRQKFVAKELEVVHLMSQKGVRFLAGTDTPAGVHIFPGFSLHEELQRFVAAGFSPLEALQTATVNAAEFFGAEEQFGTVEAGKFADLVLLRANPLEDIRHTQEIAGVVVNGRYFSRKELDAMLAGVEATARGN